MEAAEQDLLVMAAQDGSRGALESLVRLYQRELLRFAYGQVGDPELARDAVQEAWIRVAQNLRKLEDPRAFRAWVYRQVRWRLMDQLRRAQRRDGLSQDGGEIGDEGAQARANARNHDLQRGLSKLSLAEREPLALFYRHGLSIQEIAEVMQLPSGTVKSRLHRARQQLKQAMEGENDETR